MNHTQGKLTACPGHDPVWLLEFVDAKAKPGIIAQTVGGNDAANAVRLALCWNCHDDLTNALRDALNLIGKIRHAYYESGSVDRVKRVMSTVKKEQHRLDEVLQEASDETGGA